MIRSGSCITCTDQSRLPSVKLTLHVCFVDLGFVSEPIYKVLLFLSYMAGIIELQPCSILYLYIWLFVKYSTLSL